MAKKMYWVSCNRFTGGIETEDNTIISSAPIIGRFIGQKKDNLFKWMKKKFKDIKIEEIKNA